jgi:peptide deformylase
MPSMLIVLWPCFPLRVPAFACEAGELVYLRPGQKPEDLGADNGIGDLLDDMLLTMEAANGVGIAAPQVGFSLRMILVRLSPTEVVEAINPEIVERSAEMSELPEGCLSCPCGSLALVSRHKKITVRYLERSGAERVVEVDGQVARCFQHEIDHLDGKTIIERTGPASRSFLTSKMHKLRRRFRADVWDPNPPAVKQVQTTGSAS